MKDNEPIYDEQGLREAPATFSLAITRHQKELLDSLNAVWDTITTAEGLVRYRHILGSEGLAVILAAADSGRKVGYTILDDAPPAEASAEDKPQRFHAHLQQRFHAHLQQRFHAHLDACSRCANQPFNPCPAGAAILMSHDRHFITKESDTHGF